MPLDYWCWSLAQCGHGQREQKTNQDQCVPFHRKHSGRLATISRVLNCIKNIICCRHKAVATVGRLTPRLIVFLFGNAIEAVELFIQSKRLQ